MRSFRISACGWILAFACLGVSEAHAAGFAMFPASGSVTGEKPQSKLFHHDGSYWAVLKGPSGVGIYEKIGDAWYLGAFADAILAPSGTADVKWDGERLYVLVYTSAPKLYELSYDPSLRIWVLSSGFPVSVPRPSGAETLVLEKDSTGRLWAAAEGDGNINVYYTTSADHSSWSSAFVLQSGVSADDICSIVAFGGNKIGVFWSDQVRDEFGFRVHRDGDDPSNWSAKEIVDHGPGHADDHINLAFDSTGRVYAITKDDFDRMAVHRRRTDGTWNTVTDVLGKTGTRGILMVAENDALVYLLYTDWEASPDRIEYRSAGLETLAFGGTTTFLSATSGLNNVSGMKQILPSASLVAVAEGAGNVWWNAWGSPAGAATPPPAPTDIVATLLADPAHVELAWSAPPDVVPDGYDVYRQTNGALFEPLTSSPVAFTNFVDWSPPEGSLCYRVTSRASGQDSAPSATFCLENQPADPPGEPSNLTATRVEPGSTTGSALLWFDTGHGQETADLSGNGNTGRLGSSPAADANDPAWIEGVSGSALRFDGDDYVRIEDSPTLDMAGSFTVETWVRRSLAQRGTVLCKGTGSKRTYRIMISSTGHLEFVWDTTSGSKRETIASSAITDNAWHHIACVYDQDLAMNRVYVDGILRATSGASGTPYDNSSTLYVGARLSSSLKEFFGGDIDQIRIAPGALYLGNFTPPGSAPAPGDDASVLLQWDPPADAGPLTYKAYRITDGGVPVLVGATATTALTDVDPGAGAICYKVTAVNAQSEEGPASPAACFDYATPPPGMPTGFQVALQDSVTPASAQLAWSAPETGHAIAYRVYRRVGTGDFTGLTPAPIAALAYTDSALVPGTSCYFVRPVDALDRIGAASDTACVQFDVAALGAPIAVIVTQRDSILPGTAAGVAVYDMDVESGQALADRSGNGHDGRLGGSTDPDTYDPLWGAGRVGGALVFDGKNDYVRIPDAPSLRLTSGFTIEAWVQRASWTSDDCIASKGDSGKRNFWLMLTSSGEIDFLWQSSGSVSHGARSAPLVLDGDWHHVAGVYDLITGESRVFLDGRAVQRVADAGTPVSDASPLYVGTRLSATRLTSYFHGGLDLVRVSNAALYDTDFTPPLDYSQSDRLVRVERSTWQAPVEGVPAGYFVERSLDGGAFARLTATPIEVASYVDFDPPPGAPCYRVVAVDAFGSEGPASDTSCVLTAKAAPVTPTSVAVPALRVFPNPFNPATTLRFEQPRAGRTRLVLYNVRGERVATLLDADLPAGTHAARWDGRTQSGGTASAGVYWARLQMGDILLHHRLVLVK